MSFVHGERQTFSTTPRHPAEDFVPLAAPMNHGLSRICRNAMFSSARFSERGRNLFDGIRARQQKQPHAGGNAMSSKIALRVAALAIGTAAFAHRCTATRIGRTFSDVCF